MIPDKYLELFELYRLCRTKGEKDHVLAVLCRHKMFIKAIKLICKNTANETIKLTDKQKIQIRRHANVISYIANSKRSGKRAIVQSGGGFISVLLPIVASLITSAINSKGS